MTGIMRKHANRTTELAVVAEFKNKGGSNKDRFFNRYGSKQARKCLWSDICKKMNISAARTSETLAKYVRDAIETVPPAPPLDAVLDPAKQVPANQNSVKDGAKEPLMNTTKELVTLWTQFHSAVSAHEQALKQVEACKGKMQECRDACERASMEFICSSEEVSAHEALVSLMF